jgi:murein DD-endopeptidase MepM/ murein hydrolase activator NlpD
MTRRSTRALAVTLAWVALAVAALPSIASGDLRVVFHPARPRAGDLAWVHVRGVPDGADVEGAVAGQTLRFFPYAGGRAALVGVDLETKAGPHPWRLAVLEPGRDIRTMQGSLRVDARRFTVQRLTLPPAMVDLDPETERRAVEEADRLRTLYRMVTPERLWLGRFVRPVSGPGTGSGFGSRRVINGQPRMPHSGLDFAAALGTLVVAANGGRVVLVADHFFPGRLVVIDHGLGLYTLYFHLDTTSVAEGQLVDRGQPIGKVGATGRATGPHLHFGVQVGPARVDPATLLGLVFRD